MKLVKAFACVCSFALASTVWAGGGLHDKSAGAPSSSSEHSSMSSDSSMSSESAASGDFAGTPWGATESDSSATGATREP
ncbi:MAG: hypothetical protein ACT4P4_14110, partial [Betaproteobacteria bacterium]